MGTHGKEANVEHMPLGNRSRRKDILQPFRIFYSLGCAQALGNITRRASGQTSLRCLGTRTREESIQKVLQMTVASCHWCYLPGEGIDFCLVSCSQQVVI